MEKEERQNGNSEIWIDNQACLDEDYYIDLCLKKLKCRTYIFVVKNTTKYKQNVVDTISSKSHMGDAQEQIVVINNSVVL